MNEQTINWIHVYIHYWKKTADQKFGVSNFFPKEINSFLFYVNYVLFILQRKYIMAPQKY